MPSLLDMTDVPLKNILENSDYKSILTLRKVCHFLRNFIDDSRFKTDLQIIGIVINSSGFSVSCVSRNALSTKQCFAKDWNSRDLTIILKLSQNTKLSGFYVKTNQHNVGGLDDLVEILKNQTRPLQTEHFEMEGSEILKVLPYIDSKLLKRISIIPENDQTNNQNLVGLEQFLELEQFKNAMELNISYYFLVRADLRKFFHFQGISVKLHETSLEELVALKDAFVSSTHMEFFNLNGRGWDENQLEQVFDTPFHDPHCGGQWFFKIKNCKEHVLRNEWNIGFLLFYKLEANEVPQDAVIQH
ncbi:unnamed protein product [Caenorhabditis brenneri]